MNVIKYIAICLLVVGLVAGIVLWNRYPPRSVQKVVTTLPLDSCNQLLVVVGDTSSQAVMYSLQRTNGMWSKVFSPIEVAVGRNGITSSELKWEGDGKTPMGLFDLPLAFGTKEDIPLHIPFVTVTQDHIWVSESQDSLYNKMYIDSTHRYDGMNVEHLIDEPICYRYVVVIDYNTSCVPEKGSAIFMHCLKEDSHSTAGCVAMPTKEMIKVLQWLDSTQSPKMFIISSK